MRGCRYKYSAPLFPRVGGGVFKVILEGNKGQESRADSTFKSAFMINNNNNEMPENQNVSETLFWSVLCGMDFTFVWVYQTPLELQRDNILTLNV